MNNSTPTFGALAPGWLDRTVMAMTKPLPDTWAGLRLAILLRRAVTTRLAYPDGALDVERWGLRMRLHPRDNGCEKNLLFTPRMYEPEGLAELENDIAKAKTQDRPFTFVDIGANVGLFSLFVASRAGREARILAIEPEPGNLRRLEFNVGANPGVPPRSRTKKIDQAGESTGTVRVAAQIGACRHDRGPRKSIRLESRPGRCACLRKPCWTCTVPVDSPA